MTHIKGFVVEYRDDFNIKHITYTRNFSDVKFLQDRFDKQNVHYEFTSFPVVENIKQRGNGLYRYDSCLKGYI